MAKLSMNTLLERHVALACTAPPPKELVEAVRAQVNADRET